MLAQAPDPTRLRSTAARKFSHSGTPIVHPRFSMTARVLTPFFIPTGAFMMTMSSRAAAAAIASLFLMSSAFAQTTTAPAASTPAATAPAKKAEKPRSPESLDCSKQADAKGLHGKERKKFRSDCMKEAKAGAATKSK
jgi:psiF repeat